MPNPTHVIRPDESVPEPRCTTECPSFDVERRQRGPDWYDEEGICRHESAMREPGDLCLPRVRELVQLSRRRWVATDSRRPSAPGSYHVLAQLADGTIEEQVDRFNGCYFCGHETGLPGAVIAWSEEPRHD